MSRPVKSVSLPAPQLLRVELPAAQVGAHRLEKVALAGYAYGPPLGQAPVAMLVGGITASPLPFGAPRPSASADGAVGDGAEEGWWPALRGDGLVDLAKTTVLCPAWPGWGAPATGSDFSGLRDPSRAPPPLGMSDLADLVALWLDGIGCKQALTFVGASLGGLVGIALAARHPEKVARLVSISAGLRPDGWGTATRHLQRELVKDGLRNGDVATGMARARQLGMLTYRSRYELDTRFGRLEPGLDRPPVAGYLDHHGRRFAESFGVNTFLMLSEAIDRCALADTEKAEREALERVTAEVFVVGVPGDLLFPWSLQQEMHRALQAVGAHSSLWRFDSPFGHDAFLADQDRLADLLRGAGALAAADAAPAKGRFEGVGKQPLREIRIGLIGCGVVGRGLLELLAKQRGAMADRYGVRFAVQKIAVRELGKDRGPLARGIALTDRPLDLVSDPEVDAIVEVAGGQGLGPVLTAALAAGKPVVTANKALLAEKLAELGVLAQRTGTPLACEAAAAAALPILRHLTHRADEVESLMAIVNGTCNFVVTRLEQDELSLAEAIEEARALGLCEADPSLDLDGHDAAAKLSILAYRSFGAWFRPAELTVRGIRELLPADCDLAEAMGFRIRHIARAARHEAGLDLAVEPLLLPDWHLLANVEEEYNAVYLRCASAGDLSFFGKGAGGLPTATAVLGDLIDLAQDNSGRWPVPIAMALCGEDRLRRHYLRLTAQAHQGLPRRIESRLRRAGVEVQNRARRSEGDRVHLGFLTAPATYARICEIALALGRLGRIEQVVVLGVGD